MKRINVMEYKEQVNEAKTSLLKLIPAESILEMDTEGIEALKKMFKLLDTSMTLVVEQAETINEINEKLDLLLDTKTKGQA